MLIMIQVTQWRVYYIPNQLIGKLNQVSGFLNNQSVVPNTLFVSLWGLVK